MNKQDLNMVCGTKIEIIEEKENYVHYNTHQKSGDGTLQQYQLWEGVYLSLMNFYVSNIEYSDVQTDNSNNLICINHCDVGVFEGIYKNGQCIQVSEGDTAISLTGVYDKNSHCFPLSRYRGINLILDLEKVNSSIINVLDEDYVFELESIKKRIDKHNCFVLYKNQSELNEIFKGFYNNFNNKFYLKVKTLELLYFLCEKEIKGVTNTRYYEKQQLQKVNQIKDFLINNIATRYTISQLANEFDISVTSLKECFKEVHGIPIGEYMRNYRISFAQQSLAETDSSIADIAHSIGYENQSKFTQTFKKITGMTPIEYRNKKANK